MQLHIKADQYGRVVRVLTPNGEEIEGVVRVELPQDLSVDDFPLVKVVFAVDEIRIDLLQDASKRHQRN